MMEKELKRTEAIIDSMTWEERNDHRPEREPPAQDRPRLRHKRHGR